MKKINNLIAIFILLQGLYLVYTFSLIFTRFINTFDYSPYQIYVYGAYIGTTVLLIIAGVGLFYAKKWSIICLGIAISLPLLLKLIESRSIIPLENNYIILGINIIVLVYLLIKWKKID